MELTILSIKWKLSFPQIIVNDHFLPNLNILFLSKNSKLGLFSNSIITTSKFDFSGIKFIGINL